MASHQCPGPDCTRQVANDLLACRDHWYAIPKSLRTAVWRAYRGPGMGSPEHLAAVRAAVASLQQRQPAVGP